MCYLTNENVPKINGEKIIMQMGYAKFEDIDCVFNEEKGNIKLIAKNEKDGNILLKADKKKNYFFEYVKSDCKNCYAYIEDTISDIFEKTINLKTKFIIKNFIIN